jgi:6-phosphogluconolactonase
VVVADPAALAQEAAKRFAQTAEAAVAGGGRFTVALAGGSTPRALYGLLAEEPYRSRVPWRQVHLFWGDERAVPPDHPDSNFGMAWSTLLGRVPVPPAQVHRMEGERVDPDAAAADYEAALARTFAVPAGGDPPSLDLVLLGLGADGHTASLFPHTEAVREARRWVVRNRVPRLGADRLTMTAPLLNRAAAVLFIVAGPDKAAALQRVLAPPPDPERFPAQLIRPAAGRVTWLADRAAAGRLPQERRDPA